MPQFNLKHVIIVVVVVAVVAANFSFGLQGNRFCMALSIGIAFLVPLFLVHALIYLIAVVLLHGRGWLRERTSDPITSDSNTE